MDRPETSRPIHERSSISHSTRFRIISGRRREKNGSRILISRRSCRRMRVRSLVMREGGSARRRGEFGVQTHFLMDAFNILSLRVGVLLSIGRVTFGEVVLQRLVTPRFA